MARWRLSATPNHLEIGACYSTTLAMNRADSPLSIQATSQLYAAFSAVNHGPAASTRNISAWALSLPTRDRGLNEWNKSPTSQREQSQRLPTQNEKTPASASASLSLLLRCYRSLWSAVGSLQLLCNLSVFGIPRLWM